MSITRRQFLLTAPVVTAGLLLPPFINESLAHIDKIGQSILTDHVPPYVRLVYHNVYTIDDNCDEVNAGYFFGLYGPINTSRAPVMTHREAARFLGYKGLNEYVRGELVFDESRVPESFNSDEIADLSIYFGEWYYPHNRFEANEYAYDWLGDLDLSLRKKGQPGLDCLEFIEKAKGFKFSNDRYNLAKVPDMESLLLLKQRLEILGVGTIMSWKEFRFSWPESPRDRHEKAEFLKFIKESKEYSNG